MTDTRLGLGFVRIRTIEFENSVSEIFEYFCVLLHTMFHVLLLLIRPGLGAEYCNQPVCLSVREHISGTAGPIDTKFCAHIPRGRGSVLLRRRCATLCTSGFMDDVMFGRNGCGAVRWRLHSASAINYVCDRGGV